MPRKSVLAALAIGSLVFAVSVSGCNRDKRTAMRTTQSQQRRATPSSVRPAEVLAASAYRPPSAGYHSEPVQFNSTPTMVAYIPEPAPAVYVSPVYSASEPTALNHPQLIHPTPELVVARANIAAPQPQLAPYPVVSKVRQAPIPELEPIRYQRLPAVPANNRPAAEIMMSKGKQQLPDRQQIRRALAPLAQTPTTPQPQQKNWVASPITAMRTTR